MIKVARVQRRRGECNDCPQIQRLWTDKVERQFSDDDPRDGHRGNNGGEDAEQKDGVVPPADALVQPHTVVIKRLHAFVADAAVLGLCARRLDVAQVASRVLNHMPVLAAIEFGDNAIRRVFSAQLLISRVEQKRG